MNGRGSSGLKAAADLDRAEWHRERRRLGSLEFRTVRGLLHWYARMIGPTQGAKSARPRLDRLPDGSSVIVAVDGSGPGGGREDVLVLLLTVSNAINALRARKPGYVRAMELAYLDGLTQEEIGKKVNCNQSTVSRWIGWCEESLAIDLDIAGWKHES